MVGSGSATTITDNIASAIIGEKEGSIRLMENDEK
jgi:hypothetical protein